MLLHAVACASHQLHVPATNCMFSVRWPALLAAGVQDLSTAQTYVSSARASQSRRLEQASMQDAHRCNSSMLIPVDPYSSDHTLLITHAYSTHAVSQAVLQSSQ